MAAISEAKEQEETPTTRKAFLFPDDSNLMKAGREIKRIHGQIVRGAVRSAEDVRDSIPKDAPIRNTPEVISNIGDAHQSAVKATAGLIEKMSPVPKAQAAPAADTVTTPTAASGGGDAPAEKQPLLNNPWSMSSQAMTRLGNNNLFATGQQAGVGEQMMQWGHREGNTIQNLMLPPALSQAIQMMDEETQGTMLQGLAKSGKFSGHTETLADNTTVNDTAKDVTVIRGMREFKGGKEKVDDMTAERKTQQSIRSAISDLASAKDRGLDESVVGGVITSMTGDQSKEKIAEIGAKGKGKAEKPTIMNIKTKWIDENGLEHEESIPAAMTNNNNRIDYVGAGGNIMTVHRNKKGSFDTPEGFNADEMAKFAAMLEQMGLAK